MIHPLRKGQTLQFAAALLSALLLACPVRAEEVTQSLEVMTDTLYKGVVGKALDALPMDPEERVTLQRTNAVVSGTMTGRSLSVWAGLTNPVLLVGGLIWGIFSATNIKAADQYPAAITTALAPRGNVAMRPLAPIDTRALSRLARSGVEAIGAVTASAGAIAASLPALRLSADAIATGFPEMSQPESAIYSGLAASF